MWIVPLLKRFPKEGECDIDSIEMSFLKSKAGNSTVMEDTPDQLPGIGILKINDIIDGPLSILPYRGKKWDTHHFIISGGYLS